MFLNALKFCLSSFFLRQSAWHVPGDVVRDSIVINCSNYHLLDIICISTICNYRHARKSAAEGERLIPDALHAVWYRYARKPGAPKECISIDSHHAVRNRHTSETITIMECILPDVCHAVRDRHTC